MAQTIYAWILFISYIFATISEIKTKEFPVSSIIVSDIYIALGFLVGLLIYKNIKTDTRATRNFEIHINYNAFHKFMSLFLIIATFYCIYTGDNFALRGNTNSSSPIASLLQVDGIFVFYYCSCHEDNRSFTLFNGILYVLYKIILGYAGAILSVFFLELYYRTKDRNFNQVKVGVLAALALIGGGMLYSVVYPLKFAIRYNKEFNLSDRITLYEGISNLCLRFSHLHTDLYVRNHFQDFIYAYKRQNIFMMEFKSIFRSLIPSAIFKNKYFYAIGTLMHNLPSGMNIYNGSDCSGILEYLHLLITVDPLSFIGWIIVFVICTAFIKSVCTWLQTYDGQFDYFYFDLFFVEFSTLGNLGALFTDTYIKVIFFIPLLFVLGIFKVDKITEGSLFNITLPSHLKL